MKKGTNSEEMQTVGRDGFRGRIHYLRKMSNKKMMIIGLFEIKIWIGKLYHARTEKTVWAKTLGGESKWGAHVGGLSVNRDKLDYSIRWTVHYQRGGG